MVLNYNELSSLSANIRDGIISGIITLYKQKEDFDNLGTSYILVIETMILRLNSTGEFILPPLDKMPENADITNIVEMKKDQ